MRTIVYQSYRTTNVPSCITRCMETVRHWTDAKGFEYMFIDDRLFDYVPEWYRKKANGNMLLISDLARLKIARELLDSGYQRTVWVDADVFVFSPAKLSIEVTEEYSFCKEVWVENKSWQEVINDFLRTGKFCRITWSRRVNNAVMAFVQNNSLLEFYIHAAEKLVRNRTIDEIGHCAVGTSLLSMLYAIRFHIMENVGLFSPLVTRDIAAGGGPYAHHYGKIFGTPIYAANLGSSMLGKTLEGVHVTDELFNRAMDQLMATQGKLMNVK